MPLVTSLCQRNARNAKATLAPVNADESELGNLAVTYDDETKQGIQAIIDLQKYAGKTETLEQAKIGWSQMSTRSRQATLRVHRILFPHKYPPFAQSKEKGQAPDSPSGQNPDQSL